MRIQKHGDPRGHGGRSKETRDAQRVAAHSDTGLPLTPAGFKGISSVTLADAGVISCRFEHGQVIPDQRGRCVAVPFRHPDRRTHRWQVYLPDGGRWKTRVWSAGVGTIMFGLETIPQDFAKFASVGFLCESPTDALALRSEIATLEGRRVVALATAGTNLYRPEYADMLSGFHTLFLAADGDQAGRAMIERVREDLPDARPVWLPDGEDVRSLLQAQEGVSRFLGLVAEADELAAHAAAFAERTPTAWARAWASHRDARRAPSGYVRSINLRHPANTRGHKAARSGSKPREHLGCSRVHREEEW